MASSAHTQRVVLAGLSFGVGLAAPVVAYAVTLPFGPANEVVASGAIPFAAGAVTGVGFYAAAMGVAEHRAEARAKQAEQNRVFGGAQPTTQFKTNPSFEQSQQTAQNVAFDRQPTVQDDRVWDRPVEVLDRGLDTGRIPRIEQDAPADTGSLLSGITGAFQRRRSLDDVPTIARAADAPNDDEAWAMIDSMLDEDSPVSCDPSCSRDVFEVAIDELKGAASKTGSINREDIAAAARVVAGSKAVPAGTTAQFVSMVAAANATATKAAAAQDGAWTQPASAAHDDGISREADDAENVAAREAAVNSLWGTPETPMAGAAKPTVPYNDALASLPVITVAGAEAPVSADDTFISSVAANVSQPGEPQPCAPVVDQADDADAATEMLDEAPSAVDVPMADYSGHEDMWAAALAVLDEPAASAPVAVDIVANAPAIDSEPSYIGMHSRVLPDDTARLSRKSIERAEAIAEGVLANRRHARINKILEEEIDRIDSRSVRRTGHEYLSVIEGGTSPFSPLQAEA